MLRTVENDVWVQWWRKQCRGEVVVIRFADDFVIGFERKDDADRCLSELHEPFTRFGLRLHDTKTRLIEFGRNAAGRRKARGEGRPETFDFPGFTHRCGVTRTRWMVHHPPGDDRETAASDSGGAQTEASPATSLAPRGGGALAATLSR